MDVVVGYGFHSYYVDADGSPGFVGSTIIGLLQLAQSSEEIREGSGSTDVLKETCITAYGHDLVQHMDERYTQGLDDCFQCQ